jgi:hypothetical protein
VIYLKGTCTMLDQVTIPYRLATYGEYVGALGKAKASRGAQGAYVSVPHHKGYFVIADDGMSGYSLSLFGGLRGVFSHIQAKGRLGGMIEDALHLAKFLGFHLVSLECFEPLDAIYKRHGFVETGRVSFDPDQAPPDWPRELGTPDVIFMTKLLAHELAIAA